MRKSRKEIGSRSEMSISRGKQAIAEANGVMLRFVQWSDEAVLHRATAGESDRCILKASYRALPSSRMSQVVS